MLPEVRQSDYLYSVPKFDLDPNDINGFFNELRGFHEQFADCFLRSESREHFFRYMSGQFSELTRKSIEPIACATEGGKVRAMQRFVSDASWDDKKIMCKYRNFVNEDLGDPEGALVFDESGFIKKGDNSIGVSRQYCGTAGKVDNCQVGVFAAYTSPYGYALVNKRLFIPEKWFGPEYEMRREKCKLPDNIGFKTKPQLAVDMLEEIIEEKTPPARYILADSLYGNSPEFIEAAESLAGITYMVQIPETTLCWLKQPVTIKKDYTHKGKKCTKKIVSDESGKPISFKNIAVNLNDFFWYRRKVSEGTKGPIEYEFTKKRVVLAKDSLPHRTVWLLIRRTIEKHPQYSFFISNAATSVRLKKLLWLSGLRWSIEQCFEESKTEIGMDHYEVRKFPGWHHHILTCMLAHFFLWHLKIRLGKKSTSYYSVAA